MLIAGTASRSVVSLLMVAGLISRFLPDGGASRPTSVAAADTWITAKVRLHHGTAGRLALLAGVKVPTGDDDVRLSNGERLEPSSQPGTGAVDEQVGLGFSRYLTPRLTLDWRLDSTNVLNIRTYTGVNAVFGGTQFGLPSQVNTPRRIVSTLRLRF